jgi:hypothetical protein
MLASTRSGGIMTRFMLALCAALGAVIPVAGLPAAGTSVGRPTMADREPDEHQSRA